MNTDASNLPRAAPLQFSLGQLMMLLAASGVALAGARYFGIAGLVIFGAAAVILIQMVCGRSIESTIAGIGCIVFACLLFPFAMRSRQPAAQVSCSHHLKQLALALQSYHDTHGSFPPASIADHSGRPMHSWRVLILPYIEQTALYAQYRFDEPWDGPHNRQLADQIVPVFHCPSSASKDRTETNYVAVVSPNTIWPPGGTARRADVTDGPGQTILLVEVENSGIHWMEPRDLDWAAMSANINPRAGLGISSSHRRAAHVALADGRVRALSDDTTPQQLQAWITIDGGETIPFPE